jgi:hypothetical protein
MEGAIDIFTEGDQIYYEKIAKTKKDYYLSLSIKPKL